MFYTTKVFVLSLPLVPNEPYPLKGDNLLISNLVLESRELIDTQRGLDRVWRQWQPPPSEPFQSINVSYYSKHDEEIVLNLFQNKHFVY